MKTRFAQRFLWAVAFSVSVLFSQVSRGQNGTVPAPVPASGVGTSVSADGTPAPADLSYGSLEVLRLAQAKINESSIVAYVNNYGYTFNLNAGDILYLRGQGVSTTVLTAMINHQGPAAPPGLSSAAPAATQTTTQPNTVYVQQPSTVYAAPSYDYTVPYYTEPYYSYSYPDYYPYYYGYPAVSFGFGFGGRGFRGHDFHSGGFHGGGFHGGSGGFHGGHHR